MCVYVSMRLSGLASLLLVLPVLAACSAVEDDVAGIEQAHRIDPSDTDPTTPPGKLVVRRPSKARPNEPKVDVVFTADTGSARLPLSLDVETSAKPMTGCVSVKSADLVVRQTSAKSGATRVCGVAIKSDETTTVTLPSIDIDFDTRVVSSGFGPVPALKIYQVVDHEEILVHDVWPSAYPKMSEMFRSPVLVAPGTYRFAWSSELLGDGGLGERIVTVGEGERVRVEPYERLNPQATIDVRRRQGTLPTSGTPPLILWRSAAPVGSPEPLKEDLHACPTGTEGCSGAFLGRSEGIVHYTGLWPTSIPVFPFPAGSASYYDLVVNGVSQRLELEAGKTTSIRLQRLEVGDVSLTRNDGSRYLTKGTFHVWHKGADGAWQPLNERRMNGGEQHARFSTGWGIDVLPGEYKVKIDYMTTEAGPKSQEHIVDLR